MLLSEAVTLWTKQRQMEGYSPATLTSYRMQMGLLVRRIGDMPVADVTLHHLRDYAGMRSEKVKAATVAHGVRMIRSFFTWCVEEELLARSPAYKLREPKLPERIPKALAFDDLELVRDACVTAREHALVEFLFASGCRAAEVSGIKRSDVDWNRRSVIVLGKGNKQREVYFGARSGLWLRRYLDSRKDDCPYLFTSGKGFKHKLSPHQIWWAVKRVAARAGMRDRVWPHVFRHTLGTMLLNQGAPLAAVQSILGHQKPETTQIYAHLSGASRQQAYQRYFIQ